MILTGVRGRIGDDWAYRQEPRLGGNGGARGKREQDGGLICEGGSGARDPSAPGKFQGSSGHELKIAAACPFKSWTIYIK